MSVYEIVEYRLQNDRGRAVHLVFLQDCVLNLIVNKKRRYRYILSNKKLSNHFNTEMKTKKPIDLQYCIEQYNLSQ